MDILLLCLLASNVAALLFISHMVRRHGALTLLGRYITGHHLDGVMRSDAGWITRGTKPLTSNNKITWWAAQPRARRAGIRIAALMVPPCGTMSYLTHPFATIAVLTVSAAASGCIVVRRGARQLRRLRCRIELIQPLYEAIAPITEHPVADAPYRWITLHGDLKAGGTLRIRFPRHFAAIGKEKALVTLTAGEKLDVDLVGSWHLAGHRPYVDFTRAPEPPRTALLDDMRDVLDRLKRCEVYIASGMANSHLIHNFDRDAPHVAFSGGTGAGKSTFLGLNIAQLHRSGSAHIVVCDPKRGDSVPFLEGIEGITIYDTIEGMWWGIKWVREQMEYRYDNYTRDQLDDLDPLVLVIDEMNMFCEMSKEFWDEHIPKGARRTPPVYKHIKAIAFMGRARRVFMISAAQKFEGQLFGNAVRDQFGGKALCRFSVEAWKSIVGLGAKPRVSRIPGRGVWVIDDDISHAQFLYAQPDGIRNLALERALPVIDGGPGDVSLSQALEAYGAGEDPEEPWDTGTCDKPTLSLVPSMRGLVSLRQASADHGEALVPLSLVALRKRFQRNPDVFPSAKKNDGEWFLAPEELQEWWENQEAS